MTDTPLPPGSGGDVTLDLIIRAFRIFNGFNGPSSEELWWRTGDEYAPVTLLVNCNDLFVWGCADCETLTVDDIEALEATYAECLELDKGHERKDETCDSAHLLWCARKRGIRPQWAYYKHFPERMHALFNAVSPDPGYGWPKSPVSP